MANLTRVDFVMHRSGDATGTITCEIYAADESHLPTGSALGSDFVDVASLPPYGSEDAIEFDFTVPVGVSTEYVCVLELTGSDDFGDAVSVHHTGTSSMICVLKDIGGSWATTTIELSVDVYFDDVQKYYYTHEAPATILTNYPGGQNGVGVASIISPDGTPSKPTTPSPADGATNITLDEAQLGWVAG